ncbi:MAG: GNAT family N-acetyltransferase [Tatlockia sp.]|nr:GNAT family N-acetyltransferase [Tatlockia sp.]
MSTILKIFDSFDKINLNDYSILKNQCNAPLFYDHRFLMATEQAHLLPIIETHYFVAYENNQMVAFMPSYMQSSADPFGVLAKTTSMSFEQGNAFFSHIMHCYESTILAIDNSVAAYKLIFNGLAELARQKTARYFGILNIIDENVMTTARNLNLHVNYMWDRFYADFSAIRNFEEFLATLPTRGRGEVRRQLRKFENDKEAFVHMEKPPFIDINEVAELCYQTTKKNGTPHYYPRESFVKFLILCGDLVRILTISSRGKRIGVLVCFSEAKKLHLWAGGMIYDKTEFSPYTILFVEAFKFAIDNNLTRVEAGRTNAKIKSRLGLSPLPLYSIVGETLV